MIITFTGAQSTGKTTLLDKLKENTKIAQRFTFAESFTRKLQRQRNLGVGKSGDEMQRAVLQAHLDNLEKGDVILDRCLLDGAIYTRYYAMHGQVSASVLREAYIEMLRNRDKYDIVFYLKPEFGIVADGERPTSVDFQREIAKQFEDKIHYMRNVVQVSGSIEERMDTIYNVLRGHGIKC